VNEQLEAFRKRLRGPDPQPQPRERIKAREWVTIFVSLTALALSLVTAYFGVVRQVEELRIFTATTIPMVKWLDDGRLQLDGPLDIAFLNTGTRPVVILAAYLFLVTDQDDEISKAEPCNDFRGGYPFDLDSFVLKEKESVTKLLKLKLDLVTLPTLAEVTKEGKIQIRPRKNIRDGQIRSVAMCIRIEGATSSRQELSAEFRLAQFEKRAGGIAIEQPLPKSNAFWTKRGTIFDME
jgi:hypothetical protein